MRPGQAAPEFTRCLSAALSSIRGFNEAGAGCPGIHVQTDSLPRDDQCFNEAGAGCPGIRTPRALERGRKNGFNEAGAGCPGIRNRRNRFQDRKTTLQ